MPMKPDNSLTNPNVADILIEALPYIRQFVGKTIIVKYGGHAMVDQQLKEDFARDIILLKFVGLNPVIIHGGGPQINKVLEQMGISSKFVRGMRMTDEPTMDVVEMVLGGKVNKAIVALINREGGEAVGLSGKDGDLIRARKLNLTRANPEAQAPEIIDIGHVGEVESIDASVVDMLVHGNFIPVVAPIGVGSDGHSYNINADLVAAKVAIALEAERLVFLTDIDGVMGKSGQLVSSITAKEVAPMIQEGAITGGMIPKIEFAMEALTSGIEKVHIINGTRRHSLLLELFTDKGIGTELKE